MSDPQNLSPADLVPTAGKPLVIADIATSSLQKLINKGDIANGLRSLKDASGQISDLAKLLNIPDTWVSWEDDKELNQVARRFIIEVVMNAAWYTRKIGGAKDWLKAYVALLVLLIIGVPLGLSLLGNIPAVHTSHISETVGVITGALTGIFGLQKALAGWAAQQQRYGAWYRASSALKTIFYRLQTDWQGRVTFDRSDDFVSYLRARIDDARQIVTAEEQAYFDNLTWPSVDVLDLLTSTRAATADLVAKFIPAQRTASIPNAVTSPAPAEKDDNPTEQPPTVTPPSTQQAINSGLIGTVAQMNTSVADMSIALSSLSSAQALPLQGLLQNAIKLADQAEAILFGLLPPDLDRTAPPNSPASGQNVDVNAASDTIISASNQLQLIQTAIVAD